jgi:YfiH family protein
LAAVPTVVHGFTSRDGGVSTGSLASLNLALRAGERPEALTENWRRVATTLSPGLSAADVAVLHQVHGAEVVEVRAPGGPLAPLAEADAAWTAVPGVVLGVRVADCAPVLLATPGGVAVAHAGWRGAAAGVVERTVAALCAGTHAAPSAVVAVVGPCISVDHFEVGEEVVAALAATGLDPAAFSRPGPRGRPMVDLAGVVLGQLALAGVVHAAAVRRCTVGDPAFWSHRRDGEGAGRFAGLIARVSS